MISSALGMGLALDIRPKPQASNLLPVNATLVTAGDSITANLYQQNSNFDRGFAGSGWLTRFLQAIGHRLRIPYNGNLAVVGNTLAQIRDSFGTGGAILNALNPDVVSFMGGTNNLNDSFSDTQLTALYDQIFSLLLASPSRLIIVSGITPRPAASPSGLTANGERQRQMCNAYQASVAAAHADRMMFVNLEPIGLVSGDFTDNLHPNISGAQKIGAVVAAAVAPRLAAGNIADPVPLESYTINPGFAGGSTLAPDWTNTVQPNGGATIAFTKEAGTDCQLVNISGTYSGTNLLVELTQNYTTTQIGKSPAAGAQFEAILDYDLLDTAIGINGINALYYCGTSAFGKLAQGQALLSFGSSAAPTLPTAPGRYQMRAACLMRDVGTPGLLYTRLTIVLRDAATASPVDLKLRLRKLVFQRLA